MIHYNFLEKYRSIICLNGELPEPSFFTKNIKIIAADGAANQLINIGVKPSVIIGDLDSIEIDAHKDSEIIQILDQSKSDFQKALEYVEQNNLLPTLITGVSGGFIDHILNNINIILEKKCAFYAHPILGHVLKSPDVFSMRLNVGTKISLFGMNKARVTSSGLKWDLNNDILDFPGFNSSLNRTSLESIIIEVTEGSLLLLIYTEEIQDGALA